MTKTPPTTDESLSPIIFNSLCLKIVLSLVYKNKIRNAPTAAPIAKLHLTGSQMLSPKLKKGTPLENVPV